MPSFAASDVKKLREQTGAGMMACKNALSESGGDFEGAIDFLRKKGLAAAQKKQGRVAAEGMIFSLARDGLGVLLEVNCETDFVAKGEDFQNFGNTLANAILDNSAIELDNLISERQEEINELTLKLGEKIAIRRFEVLQAESGIGHYNHGGRIGVLVNVKTDGDAASHEFQELIKDLAMHIAAANPIFVASEDIDENFKNKEAEIYAAQLREAGKPENMIDKIVQGKLRKMATEVCLLEQKFVKNPDVTIKKLLSNFSAGTAVLGFNKFNLGEGMEKKADNLAQEVAKMSGKA